MESADYRRIARENLAGNWGNAVLAAFLAALLGGLITASGYRFNLNLDEQELARYSFEHFGAITTITATTASAVNLVYFILGGVIRQGYAVYLLKQYDRRNPQTNDLFSQFHRFGDGFCLKFLENLFITLWTLLLIIPGIVKTYAYAMAPFILAENPNMTASQALRASCELMDGHKAELFYLELSFIGWHILNLFTLGIGSFWLNPYQNAARAAFYRNLSYVTVN